MNPAAAQKINIFIPRPNEAPPLDTAGPIGWIRQNLFNGKGNSLLTILALLFLLKTVPALLSWALFKATWVSGAACDATREGACWAFVVEKFRILMVGIYPSPHLWRPAVSFGLLATVVILTLFRLVSARTLAFLWFSLPLPLFWIINGGMGLAHVDQSLWGGLMLSMGLAVVGILFSLPLGILLALGRRSRMASVKALSIGIIELIRGVPLITILFMASVMLPLFLPKGVNINNLLRVQIGVILFSSAYIAEVIRGGLQAIPPGQMEAAVSTGLTHWQATRLVVLPQALRHVIPSIIGRCVALFKDTSLVIIVGLLDFLGMIKASTQDPEWLGYEAEAYVFCALVYWIICFSISRYGRSIEKNNAW
ncbi:amino acid ABC transporter permease [Desulfoluna sp.]|uniref:amino acid ABC transporter permease n=1 Tax=Desulfoluna sp. TaxID=2045199 RepID=UPI00262FF8AF|nr:amino acid ABC transporter permease [Desulfoluna sp.]